MKSRKKKTAPVRAKRYNQKKGQDFEYETLEARQLLAADFLSAINYVGNTDLINLNNPVPVTEGVEILRSQLELGSNESLKLEKVSTDQIGFEHFKYQQYFNDILVEGSAYTLHVKDSQIVSMSGDRVGIVAPVTTIHVSNEDALQSAMDHIGATEYSWQDEFTSELLGLEGAPEGQLVYISDSTTGASIPAYKFDMWAIDLGTRDYVYINALTGVVEATYSRVRDADVDATGLSHYNSFVEFTADQVSDNEFRLRQVSEGVETYDNLTNPRNDFSNAVDITASSPFFDAPTAISGVSAHWGAENTLAFFQDWFGRDSYDDQSSTLVSYVNVQENWNNATWNGSVMQYGEGDGSTFNPLVEIDIVGHEIAHGVTEFSANLIYQNEMGALNESFSDIFGETVEYYATGSNDWLLGANSYIPAGGLRSFLVPNDGQQPDTYLGDFWFTGTGDNGGVHFNSGVQNKWYYILSEGEAGVNDNGDVYDVTGIGIEDAAQIAYRNLTTYLSPFSQYQDARDGAVQSAIDLFGERSPEHLATSAAWAAVGLYSQDISITEFDEVVPGSRIFRASAVGEISPGETRGVLMELDAGQTISAVVDGKNVSLDFEVEDPNGFVLASSVDGPGNRTSVNTVPVTAAGEYRINVGTNGSVDDFKIEIVLNATLESEIGLPISNGQFSDAQLIEDSAIAIPRGERLGVYGEFAISEIPSFAGDNFESGALDGTWTTNSTTESGRIRVSDLFGAGEGNHALFMDTSASGYDNLNEAIWTVDLSSVDSTFLNFYYASFNDENAELPVSFNGTTDGDGVSVSADGETWHTILTDSVTNAGEWNQRTINLADFATNVGIDLHSNFQIKFQQFDDDRLGSDGRAFDGISLTDSASSEDWYKFDLEEGQLATLAVSKTFVSGDIDLELYDSEGNLLLQGTPGEGIESRISLFEAEAADTYFARLSGSSTPYGFVVTRGADFDTGSSEQAPQDISQTRAVAGYVNTVATLNGDPDSAPSGTVLDNFFDGVTLSNNATGGSVFAVQSSFEAPTGTNVFAPAVSEASGWTENVNEIRADFAIPQQSVSIVVGAEESAEDVGFIRAYDILGEEIDEQISRPLEPGETQTISVFSSSREIAYIVAGGFQNDVTPLDKLSYEIAQDASDFYSFNVDAKQDITISATFPGRDALLFENGLVTPGGTVLFRMQLIDSSGAVVASGSETLNYYSDTAGTYTIRASAVAGSGDYDLMVETETVADRFQIGNLRSGIAADDFYEGVGYLMYTVQKGRSRFPANPPGSTDHVIPVRYNAAAQTWEYNNNTSNWFAFTPAEGDRLLASVDYTNDVASSLEGFAGRLHGINLGFAESDLQFIADSYNGSANNGEFELTGTYFRTGDEVRDLGTPKLGIVSADLYRGEGYLMYSEEALKTRFGSRFNSTATNVISVRFDSGSNAWEYHDNYDWTAFTPTATDRLLAHVDHNLDVITPLEGISGKINGIKQGFFESDATFIANQWAGAFNRGEFAHTGTYFEVKDVYFETGDVGSGVAVHENAAGSGFIMYSEDNVFDRFSFAPPAPGNAEHFVAVRFTSFSNFWQFSNNFGWVNFDPAQGDRLIAEVDFTADSIEGIAGRGGRVNGIYQGYLASNLKFEANKFGGVDDANEFQLTGSFFTTSHSDTGIGDLKLGILGDDNATGQGFIMYSEQNLNTRFPGKFIGGTSHQVLAVRFEGGVWQYNNNSAWNDFTPVESDRLIATVDFAGTDSITLLKGVYGSFEGITQGVFDSDLTFVADQYNGLSNTGEIQVYGTSFIG